jgi:hypothetical protein
MAAVTAEGPTQYRVRWEELASKGLFNWRRRGPVLVDPYLIGRAIAAVMDQCSVRTATGRRLLWNEYRVVLAQRDCQSMSTLSRALERELCDAIALEVKQRRAELVGALAISVVADEAGELEAGHAVVRTAFTPSEARGAETRFAEDADPQSTIAVPEGDAYVLRWPGGQGSIAPGTTVIVGRPHASAPSNFIALEGAGPTINKQHLSITAGPDHLRIVRLPSANPVSVGDHALAAGGAAKGSAPLRITLSKGDLVLVLSRA